MRFARSRFWALFLAGMAGMAALPAHGFATGTLLSLSIDPATIRQTGEKAFSKAVATVVLQDPAPVVFVCLLRSDEPSKIHFPTIVFHKGDKKASCVGKVEWKTILRARRIRITALDTDAPDWKLTFTVLLVPEEEAPAAKPDGV